MSIIYHIVGKPLPGKQKSMLSQFRTGAGIMSRLGSLETRVHTIVMGNAAHTLSCIQTAWTDASDIRDKCVYGEVPYGKVFLENVNTIKYSFKNRETDEITDDRKRYGFSAQEIASLEDEPIIVPNPDDDKLGLTHEYLLPVVVNAIKELSAENRELRERIIVLENAVGIST